MKTIFGFQNVSVFPYIRGITIPELARWRPAQTHGALLEYRVFVFYELYYHIVVAVKKLLLTRIVKV